MFPFWIEFESGAMVQLAAIVAAGLVTWFSTGAARGIRT
jgi:hypothetical protein